jgi:branched-subunit amino acid ABC-type transport system permease component
VLQNLAFAVANGLVGGMAIFLVATGLTLVFGILKILNFAHGTFFMLGAYIVTTIAGREPSSLGIFFAATFAAALVVAALGLIVDFAVLRRLRNVDEHYALIATFAVLLVCEGAVKMTWGVDPRLVAPPPSLEPTVALAPGLALPRYSIFVFVAGIVVFIALEIAVHRMWIGKVMQALANDSWISGLLGVNVSLGLTATVVASFFLAGLAGGILVPNQSLSPDLGASYLLLAFTAVIIGGLGNVRGAFVASLLLGLIESLSSVLLPKVPGLPIYFALVVFLLWKPNGLFGKAQT